MSGRMGGRCAMLTCAATILVASGRPSVALGSPADYIGAGARNSAMANTGVSSTRDASASYYNPSALAWLGGAHLDLGYTVGLPELSLNDVPVGPGDLQAWYLAFAAPGTLFGHAVAGGIVIMAPLQKDPLRRSNSPEFMKFEGRPKRVLLATSAAFAITERLSIGVSVQHLAGLSVQLGIDGTLGYPSGDDSRLQLNLDGQVKNSRYTQVGATWRVSDAVTLGALYREKFEFIEAQGITVKADIGLPDLPPVIDDAYLEVQAAAIKTFQPATAWASLTVQPSERLELTTDLGWFGWSAFRNPQASVTVESDFGTFDVPIVPSVSRPQPGFRDAYAARVGFEFMPAGPTSRFAFRGGYGYQSAAGAPQTNVNNFIDGALQTFAAGMGVRSEGFGILSRPLYFDIFAQWAVQPTQQHLKASPADLAGDYTSKAQQLSFGATLRLEF